MVSIVNDRIVLRSKKLNKKIIPRITCAHNFQSGLPLYRLLGDLQGEGSNVNLNFGWDSLARLYKHLPRVKYKDVILKSARWTLDENDYKVLIKKKIKDEYLVSEIKKWREEWKIPQYVVIADSDNELFIDFDDILCNRVFINNIERRPFVTLVEVSTDYLKSPVVDMKGNTYAAQFLISFFNASDRPKINTKQVLNKSKIPRKFFLGDEWVYFKVYLGVRYSDHFLTIILPKILNSLKKKGVVFKWFYVRYGDPAYHLRLRFCLSNKADISTLIFLFNEQLKKKISSGLIEKVQVDTYVRELERYGNGTIEISETLFGIESSIVIKLLNKFKGERDENIVWLITLKMIDLLLSSCKLELPNKHKVLHDVSVTFGKEFGKDSNSFLKKSLAGKYRFHKKDMYDMLKGMYPCSRKINMLIETYVKEISIPCTEIVARDKRNELGVSLDELLASHIHLLVNRIFRTNARMHEMILYDFLSSYYLSELKRSNLKQKEHTQQSHGS